MANITFELIPKLLEFENFPSAIEEFPELRYKRTVSVNSYYKLKKTPDGKRGCRRCAKEVPKGRRYWCGDVCVADALIRSHPGYARSWVEMRDKGVCAACGLDTKALKFAFDEALRQARNADWQQRIKGISSNEAGEVIGRLVDVGFRQGGDFWAADHIIEVHAGGGHCGLSNYQTLCKHCHDKKTAQYAKKRSKKKTTPAKK